MSSIKQDLFKIETAKGERSREMDKLIMEVMKEVLKERISKIIWSLLQGRLRIKMEQEKRSKVMELIMMEEMMVKIWEDLWMIQIWNSNLVWSENRQWIEEKLIKMAMKERKKKMAIKIMMETLYNSLHKLLMIQMQQEVKRKRKRRRRLRNTTKEMMKRIQMPTDKIPKCTLEFKKKKKLNWKIKNNNYRNNNRS